MDLPNRAALLLLTAALLLPPAAAHARAYVRQEAGTPNCIDDQFAPFGQGGALGGATNAVGSAVDALTPDQAGSCYRPNHVWPNENGDATFFVSDGVVTNVGFCLSQDSDNDGTFCNDSGDIQARFCNQGTVNVNTDPQTGLPRSGAWRFQDGAEAPARTTWVVVTPFTRGSAVAAPLYGVVVSAIHSLVGAPAVGPLFDCGPGVDDYGVAGNVHHG